MNIRLALIPIGITRKGSMLSSFLGVTIHNTGNHDAGATADSVARNLYNNSASNIAGFHYVVDGDEIVCAIPETEIAEHCGTRQGNDTTVSIEICCNADGDILAATELAAKLAADILKRRGHTKAVWKENLFQHNDWSGKDCPEELRRGSPYGWETFIDKVNGWISAPAELTTVSETANAVFMITKMLWYEADPDVQAVQRCLNALRYTAGPVDGMFGPVTEAALRAFQRDHNIRADGIVGPQTTRALGGVWMGP